MSDLPFDPSAPAQSGAGQPGAAQPGAAQPGAGQPGAAPGEPSEEEVRQYLAQMRGAPAEQVIAEVLQGLLNAAQVKLGRRDARLLLDTAADVAERTRSALSGDLASQIDDVVSQLRLAQVEAEKEVAAADREEPNDLQSGPAPAAGDQPGGPATGDPTGGAGATTPGQPQPGGGQPGGGQDSPLNKLWIPGR